MNNTNHVMYWGNYICIFNKLQKVLFKTSFIWKNILFIILLLNKLLVPKNLFWPMKSHYNWGNHKVNQSLYQNLSNLFYINVLWVWFTHHLFLSYVLKKSEILVVAMPLVKSYIPYQVIHEHLAGRPCM